MRYLAFCLIFLFPLHAWAQTSVKPGTLSWKFKEGEKFWIDTQVKIEQVERSAGVNIVNVIQLRTITSYVVKKVTETNFVELEAKIESTR